jgi:hypothetical protein
MTIIEKITFPSLVHPLSFPFPPSFVILSPTYSSRKAPTLKLLVAKTPYPEII